MKTTIELPDGLLAEAKRVAQRQGTTLRGLVERGLRREIQARQQAGDFTLRDQSVDGDGLQADLVGSSWDAVRDLAYKGRGA